MVAGVFLFVIASLSWTAKCQILSGTGGQQLSSCGYSIAKQFPSSSGQIGSSLLNARPQYEDLSSNLGSIDLQSICGLTSKQFLPPTGYTGSNLRQSVLSKEGPQYDSIRPSLGSFSNECGCSSSTSQLLETLTPTLKQTGFGNAGSQCESTSSNTGSLFSELECLPSSLQFTGSILKSQSGSNGNPQCKVSASNLGVFGPNPSGLLSNVNVHSNLPGISSCEVNTPSFISDRPSCGLNSFAGPITNQVVSETFVSQKPCQTCSSLNQIQFPTTSPNLGQYNGIRSVPLTTSALPAIEKCTTTVNDDESISYALANALQLLIVSNLIENLNEAAALGTFTSPTLGSKIATLPSCNAIENGLSYKDIITPIKPLGTGCPNLPSLNAISFSSPLSSNPLGPRQTPCNTGLREFINPIQVPPLGSYGGLPEIVNSKVQSGAPHIPDVINPTNLKLTEAINTRLPFGALPSFNGNFADVINPINLPSFVQPSVLPEIGNPVNLPAFGAIFSNKADSIPFNVQSYSHLVPTPGIVAYNVPEAFSCNQFNGPFPPGASNYNGPLLPEAFNSNFIGPQTNPLLALLEQLLTEKANAYNVPYGMPETFNHYTSYGAYPDQINSFDGSYGSPLEISSQYGPGYQVIETPTQLQAIPSQSQYEAITEFFAPFSQSPYAANPEATLPISFSSPSYASDAFTQTSISSFNNGFADASSTSNTYSYPAFVPVDIPGIPITLSGAFPDVPMSVTPANYFSEVKDIPAQLCLEPLMVELLIPSSIPAEMTLNI